MKKQKNQINYNYELINSLKSIGSDEVSRNVIRHYWKHKGVNFYSDTIFPSSIFNTTPSKEVVYVSIIVEDNKEMADMLKTYNGSVVNIYEENGYGICFFGGNKSFGNAVMFIEQEAEKIIDHRTKSIFYAESQK